MKYFRLTFQVQVSQFWVFCFLRLRLKDWFIDSIVLWELEVLILTLECEFAFDHLRTFQSLSISFEILIFNSDLFLIMLLIYNALSIDSMIRSEATFLQFLSRNMLSTLPCCPYFSIAIFLNEWSFLHLANSMNWLQERRVLQEYLILFEVLAT